MSNPFQLPTVSLNLTTRPLEVYEEAVRKAILAGLVNRNVNQMAADDLILLVGRIFQRNRKVFANLGRRMKQEVEVNGRDPQMVINLLAGIYVDVLRDYATRCAGQPILHPDGTAL